MTGVMEHCDDKGKSIVMIRSWRIVMAKVMEHCDDKGLEHCDDKGH